jgi:hypothetical protein
MNIANNYAVEFSRNELRLNQEYAIDLLLCDDYRYRIDLENNKSGVINAQ